MSTRDDPRGRLLDLLHRVVDRDIDSERFCDELTTLVAEERAADALSRRDRIVLWDLVDTCQQHPPSAIDEQPVTVRELEWEVTKALILMDSVAMHCQVRVCNKNIHARNTVLELLYRLVERRIDPLDFCRSLAALAADEGAESQLSRRDRLVIWTLADICRQYPPDRQHQLYVTLPFLEWQVTKALILLEADAPFRGARA